MYIQPKTLPHVSLFFIIPVGASSKRNTTTGLYNSYVCMYQRGYQKLRKMYLGAPVVFLLISTGSTANPMQDNDYDMTARTRNESPVCVGEKNEAQPIWPTNTHGYGNQITQVTCRNFRID